MGPQCLSVCGPCAQVCKGCIDSHNRAVLSEAERSINGAIAVLKNEGFGITAPDISKRPNNDALRILVQNGRVKLL
jgi:hypothetical protein